MINRISLIIVLFASCQTASALNIMLDYSLDTLGFGGKGGGAAKSAIDQAAADISSVITSTLTEVNQVDFVDDKTTLTITPRFTNPTTNATVNYDPVSPGGVPIAENTVIIYVGAQSLGGSTLAQGGPGSAQLSGSGTNFVPSSGLADTHMSRGGGPVIGRIVDVGNGIDVRLGSSLGNLWFDVNTDNSGGIDTDPELEAFWHYDHTTAPAAGKYDLYSVAMHEILHAIGVGTSESWDNLNSGGNWTGANAIAANGGSGTGLVDGGHIELGVSSFRLSDGAVQDPLMGPTISSGTRKELTTLDVAILKDLGWTTAPEPGTGMLLLIGLIVGVARRRRG